VSTYGVVCAQFEQYDCVPFDGVPRFANKTADIFSLGADPDGLVSVAVMIPLMVMVTWSAALIVVSVEPAFKT